MQGDVKIEGMEALLIRLRNISQKVPDNARKTMIRGADKIVKEAKANCPVDTDALMDSIRAEKGYDQRDAGGHGGRLNIGLTFGGLSDGKDTDDYAMLVHENYESMKPGPLTEAKMAADPSHTVGSHFLTRAVDSERNKLQSKMILAVEEGIAEKDASEGDDL